MKTTNQVPSVLEWLTVDDVFYWERHGDVFPAQTLAQLRAANPIWGPVPRPLNACPVGQTEWIDASEIPGWETACGIAPAPARPPAEPETAPAAASVEPDTVSFPAAVRGLLVCMMVAGLCVTFSALWDDAAAPEKVDGKEVFNSSLAHQQTKYLLVGLTSGAVGLLGLLVYRPTPPAI